MSAPEPWSPLAGHLVAGRHGAVTGEPLALREVASSIVDLAARRGRAGDLVAAIRGAFGFDLPAPGRWAGDGEVTAVWIKPETWLLLAPRGVEGAFAAGVKQAAGDAGSVVDQSHGKTRLGLSGVMAREALAKGCRIDLDPSAFGPGRSAVTQISQTGCVLLQRDDTPAFELVVGSSYAIPFFDWLTHAAAGFGYEIR
ncbi:N-methylglutamate dehydrogenase subunit D [Stella humosa]|uniref:N-methylglutamate dehydrogenase subunit D n=1 Tax=Stella humosa TaxID=94 RepID=A0A3N1L0F8_9PROT|nr:sarcosine oxidase subunit gamma family protein [Stella humosa]ROP84509.1 N-methylglutamate dehydrogenase subunit D [Stella humosa]BBK34029.1 hypothetical protein STHU_46630 [Stella humosa]